MEKVGLTHGSRSLWARKRCLQIGQNKGMLLKIGPNESRNVSKEGKGAAHCVFEKMEFYQEIL